MKKCITVIPGDGIGPSITEATLKLLKKIAPQIEYEFAMAGQSAVEAGQELIPQKTLDLIKKNGVALKGPITTPIGEGFKSINVTLRQQFDLYANIRPVLSLPGTKSRYDSIDIITVRENTEGMYSGEGQFISDDGERAEAKSVMTRSGIERVIQYAFEMTKKLGRKKVTLVHKANILKSTSGLFLKIGREVAKNFPDIQMKEMIVDNCCMQLVMNPHQFDVIVTSNLFGDIISDLCAGLVGGLGLAPGANIGKNTAIFEAVHGSAPDIAGKNIANPTALMLAAAMMMDYLGLAPQAHTLRKAIHDTLVDGQFLTHDLGGDAGTTEFTEAVLARI